METAEIAQKLVQLCREGKNMDVINEMYDQNIVSIEAEGSGFGRAEGKEEILKKNIEWYDSVQEFHGAEVSDPLIAAEHFACRMRFHVTFKNGQTVDNTELVVYHVKNGKIISEQFFYAT